MIAISRWARLVTQSLRRNRRDFAFSGIGIIIGIGTLLFFTALGTGIKETVLERVFVVRQLEVVKPSYDLGAVQTGGLFGERRLDDKTVAQLRRVPDVEGVYPKMKLTFPTSAHGGAALLGQDIWAELIADGIPAKLVGDVQGPVAFRDWEDVACASDDECTDGYSCVEGTCRGDACGADEGICGGHSYCHEKEKVCMMPIPIVISPQLLEIYNGSLHTALAGASGGISKLPRLSERAVIGLGFDAVFGRSYLGRAAKGEQLRRRAMLVGFSDKAISLGATMPLGYVRRLNAHFGGEDAATEYHSILVDTASNDAVPAVAQTITEDLGWALSDKYENAQRAGLLILLVTLVFNLISLIILAIAAVNIMHTFLMILLERKRELALMRAVGATRGAIRALVLGEATVLGLIGGSTGVVVGWLATIGVDALFNRQVAEFPFKPDSLFAIEGWMILACVGVAVVFCWVGALLPAFRAGRIDPAAALAGR